MGSNAPMRIAPRLLLAAMVGTLLAGPAPARASGDPVGYIAALLASLIVEGVERHGDDVARAASRAADALVLAEAGLPPIVRGSIRRARQAIALGPRGGVAVGYAPSPGRGEVAVSLGLALEVFEGPILPGKEELHAWLVEGLQARIVAVARDLAARGGLPLDPGALRPYARAILQAVHADVSGRMAVQRRWFPPPRFGVAVDGAGYTGSDGLELRLTASLGVGPVSVGPTAAFRSDPDDPGVLVGGEVAGHLVTGKGPRTPVLDLFLRLELAADQNPTTSHQGVIGLRLLIDAI